VVIAASPKMPAACLTRCPACHAAWLPADTIRLPVDGLADEMLGDTLRLQIRELVYDRCSTCGALIATDRRRDPQLLNAIYEQLPAAYWSGLNAEVGLAALIERRLHERGIAGGDLWDVGCGNGNLLSSFGQPWNKHGIEPGQRAVEDAHRKGLDVELGTPATLRLRDVADVVLLIDVAEHLVDPESELSAIKDMLRPGGTLALLTGRADAWTAQVAGPRWYYLHCVGHVTIFGGTSFQRLLSELGFADVVATATEHPGTVGLRRWLQRIGGNILRSLCGKRPAAMHYYRDHQMVLATKPHAGGAR
jgi:SAM-dependent methyltransferase